MKQKPNIFLKIMLILFIIFTGLYIASISGYYESKISNKVALTDAAIKQFEEDVLNGKNVDINSYLQEEDLDYSNKLTKLGDKISNILENFVADGFGGAWKALKVLFF